jgi:hypothetical protein
MPLTTRHCEERSDEAIQPVSADAFLDCFASLAMTEKFPPASFRGAREREPGISRHNFEVPDRTAYRGPSGTTPIKLRRIP